MLRQFLPRALAIVAAIGASSADASTMQVRRPQRVVSINLCTDQLLLRLADRSQIAGLSRNAADPRMSAEWRRAAGLPIVRTSAEQLLVASPDLVVGMPAQGSAITRPLHGKAVMADFATATRYEDIVTQIGQMARVLGHPERGNALVSQMTAQLAAIPRAGRGRVAAYYQRRGYLTGTGTLVDDLMQRLGLVNLASRLGKPALARVSLEEIVAARPDFLIVESNTTRVADQGTEMLHHPALQSIPRIVIPEAWTVCGTPSYVDAARAIAAQVARHR